MMGTFNGIPGIIEDMTLFFHRITAGIPSHIIAVFITVTAISFTAIIAVTDIVVIMDTDIVADTTGGMAAGTTEDLPLRKDRDDAGGVWEDLPRVVSTDRCTHGPPAKPDALSLAKTPYSLLYKDFRLITNRANVCSLHSR